MIDFVEYLEAECRTHEIKGVDSIANLGENVAQSVDVPLCALSQRVGECGDKLPR